MKKKVKVEKPLKVKDLPPKGDEQKGGTSFPAFRGGVNVAVGDVNGDGTLDVIKKS